MFASIAQNACALAPSNVRYDALEAQGASMLFWPLHRGCPHVDIFGASLPNFMGGSDAQQVAYTVTFVCNSTHE